MTGSTKDTRSDAEAAAAARRQREAEALRANLWRRKQQLRERAAQPAVRPEAADGDSPCR
ncbi:hypothetical protein FE249_13990 [Acidiphilium multivorum]|nr:hypothetical protein FE249_13990 [Acidiphilium multivorum]